ncbi:MAG: ABC transporter ATP-binding protein [Clostridia bacterium]|nr:ABC transporter ATP-binding protein [Clostridia bacterium]
MNLIEIRDLNWHYGDKMILQDVSLSIKRGNFYAIVGPNGSGKTTLLKNILRHLEPEKEAIFVDGKDLMAYSHKGLALQLSAVPQNTQIAYDFSVHEVVMMGRSAHIRRFSSSTKQDDDIVKGAMMITDTWHLKDASVLEISGGERQRVIIARAIAQESQIMVLDEPIANLDINHQIQVLDTVKKLCVEKGLTVITVLHDLNIAGQYADEIILVKDGAILDKGAPELVLREELIAAVYGDNFYIMTHPMTQKPLVIPMSTFMTI